MIGCAPEKEAGSADDAKAGAAGGADGKHTWEVKPEPIPADKIKETVDTEVLVIGGGYSGTCCALAAAEGGAKVTLVEKDAMLNGHGVGGTGAIASRELDKLGISFDKAVEMERWVSTCGNRCRESLVAKWFRESERCMNWFLDLAEKNGAKCMVTVGSRSVVHPEIDCYHMISGGEIFEQHTMADFVEYLFESEAKQHGAEFVYEMPAVQLVQDERRQGHGRHLPEQADGDLRAVQRRRRAWCWPRATSSYNDEYLRRVRPHCESKVMDPRCDYTTQGNSAGDGHKMADCGPAASCQDGPRGPRCAASAGRPPRSTGRSCS